MKNSKKQIGVVGVDSGQLIVCDPCYIDGEWKKERFSFENHHTDKNTGQTFIYPKDFMHYEVKLEQYEGKTPNQLISEGVWDSNTKYPAPKSAFSYNACCQATRGKDQAGQLNYALGHPGVAVAFCTGYGDGEYPVFATFKNGKIKSITIEFFN